MDSASAPVWPGRIRSHTTPGFASCLEEGRLALNSVVFPPSPLDIDALRLVEWTAASHQPFALVPLDPLGALPALVPAAVHIADIVEGANRGIRGGSSVHVAVVSRDYRLRGVYRGIQIRDPGGGRVRLRDVVPAATRGRDGVIRTLDSRHPSAWSTVFVHSVEDVTRIKGLDLVVVDLPADGQEHLLDLRVPTIIVARDPTDPLLQRFAERAALFAWESADLAGATAPALTGRLAVLASGSRVRVVAVPSQRIAVAASMFWQDVGDLVRAARRSLVGRELARLSFGLFHDLVGLAMPVSYFEAVGEPLRRRVDAVARASRLTAGDVRDLYLPMTTAELHDIVEAIGDKPPKADALLRMLRIHLDRHGDVLLMARTAALARAYRTFLADQGLEAVRVEPVSGLADVRPAPAGVLTGLAPTWARWVYGAGIVAELDVLAYAPESPLLGENGVFAESVLVRQAADHLEAMRSWLARPAQKASAWSSLSGEPNHVVDDRPQPPGRAATGTSGTLELGPPDLPVGLWDGSGWLVPLEPAPGNADGTGYVGGAPLDIDVPAVLVRFADGRSAILAKGGHVTRFVRETGRPEAAYPVARLAPGDEIVFIDDDSRKDQLAKVLEVADQVPELAVASGWVSFWRSVLGRARARFATYEAMADALRAEGCKLQTQSIRLWVVGATIGPDDPQDVRRLGVVADDPTVRDHHREIYRAIDSLRRAHQRLGFRLGALARQVGSATAAGLLAPDEIIDERTGLTAADFADSIDIVTVVAVEPAGDVPYVLTGRLGGPDLEEPSDVQ
jgi:hypothetical protein